MADPRNPLGAAQNADAAFHHTHIFLADVDSTSGNKIKIIRRAQPSPDGTFYPATAGLAAAVSPGDTVLVINLGGGSYVVIAKIVT